MGHWCETAFCSKRSPRSARSGSDVRSASSEKLWPHSASPRARRSQLGSSSDLRHLRHMRRRPLRPMHGIATGGEGARLMANPVADPLNAEGRCKVLFVQSPGPRECLGAPTWLCGILLVSHHQTKGYPRGKKQKKTYTLSFGCCARFVRVCECVRGSL